jgi:hypothetical protein
VTRMREQSLYTRDIARLVRGANAGDGRAWECLADRDARPILASTPQFKQAAQLQGAPPSPGSWRARRRIVSCLAAGVPGRGYS